MVPNIAELARLAREAGGILRDGFQGEMAVSKKEQDINLITEMDSRSEAHLLREIKSRYPGHRVVAEESGRHGDDGERTWFIDPLDGTVNYAHGVPIYSVSIAYAEGGEVQLGAVYDPSQDESFTAQRGGGAFVNGQPLQVSDLDDLSAALLVTGFPYDIWTNPVNNLDNFARLSVRTRGVRRLGSAALDLCYVAAGRFDGFWELRLKSWDVAAGGLIAQEAGALVTSVAGEAGYLRPAASILAANPALHAQLLPLLSF